MVTDLFSKISFRLPAIVILATALASLAVGGVSYFNSAEEVRRQESKKLVSLGVSRHSALTQYFRSIEEDLELLASNSQVAATLGDFRRAFGLIDRADRARQEQVFRQIFSPKTTDGDGALVRQFNSAVFSDYFHAHNRHHDWFRTTHDLKGYYDLFLVSPEGDVVYSVFKEPDFATNLLSGAWSDTGLARAVKGSLRDRIAFEDFASYAPSQGAAAAFIARPVKEGDRIIGALALQIPIRRINDVMQVTAGMGATGETYIVGQDRLMRSDSRFSKTSTILKTRIETVTATRALNGESGIAVVDDYRGVRVLSAFQPFSFRGATWAIMAEIDVAETELPVAELRNSVVFISLGLMLLVAFSGTILARSITTPLAQLSRSIREFRETHQPVDLSRFSGNDEISEIAQGFQATSTEISEYIASVNHAHEELKRGEHDIREREERMRSLIDLSPIGFILTRFGGEILITNKTFLDILGWDENAVRAPDVSQLYQNPDDRRRYVEILKRDGTVSRFETVLLRTDGEPVWITLSSKVIDFGEDRAIMAWIDDVTERKKAEREIAAKEALLRLSFDTMADGIYVLDENLNYLLFNQRYLDLVDLPPGSVAIGEPVEPAIRAHAVRGDYGHGDTEELIRKRLAVLRGPEDTSGHLSIDGGRRELDLRKASIDGGGAVVVATDVTASQRAMAALDAERARIDAIMQSVPDAVITIGIDGTIQEVNLSVERILGYTPEELVGENVKILMPEDTARVHDGYVKNYVDTGQAKFIGMGPRELTAVTKSGNAIPIELSLGEALVGGDRIFIGIARDISERKAAEANLRMAMENMPGAMWVVDSNLDLVMANDKYMEFYGDRDGVVRPGSPIERILRQEAEAGLLGGEGSADEIIERRLESYRSRSGSEFDDQTSDGRFIRVIRRPTDDGHVVSVATDVTNQKTAERAVRENEAILKSVLDHSPVAFTMKDRDRNYVIANRTHATWFGRDRDALIGSPAYQFNPAGQESIFGAADTKVFETGLPAPPIEYRDEKPFRDPIDLVAQKFPVLGADGEIIGVGTVQTDITERNIAEKKLETALETAQRALDDINAVIESIDYGVCFMDADLRARVINHEFQDMWGIDQALIDSGPTMAELMYAIRDSGVYPVPEEDFDAYVAGRVAAVRDGAIPPTELNRADGTVLIYQCIALPDGGRMLTYYDISERKKAEGQLKKAYAVISDSIQYAAHIQRAVLTGEDLMAATMASHLVLWEPRDQVGGDIYWCYIWGDGVLVIMADCTGHGVPGAFMTLISTGALDRAMSEVPPGHVGALIQRMHQIVQITLNQHGGKGVNDDGLELGVCYIDPDITEIRFAGARTSLFIVENGEVAELKATKKGIGYRGIPQTQTFEETKIKIAAGQTFYMTTDGYIDQVGGEARRMFGKNRFRELLTSLSGMPLDQQKERLRQAFVAYQGDENRRDDVSIVAFRPI